MTNEIKLPNENTVLPGSWVDYMGTKRWLIGVGVGGGLWLHNASLIGALEVKPAAITGPWVEPPPLPKLLDGAMPPRGRWLYWYEGLSYLSKDKPRWKHPKIGFKSSDVHPFNFADWGDIPVEQRCVETDRFHGEERK